MSTYQQLLTAKKEIKKFIQEILSHAKRAKFTLNNTEHFKENYEIMSPIFDTYNEVLYFLDKLTSETVHKIHKNNTEDFNKELKIEFLDMLREILYCGESCNVSIQHIFKNDIDKKDFKYYETYKKLSEKIKILEDIPKNTIENIFNCKLYYPKTDTVFDPDLMTCIYNSERIIIDDPKMLNKTEFGTFVSDCEMPAIIDKNSNELYLDADVGTYVVEPSRRLSNFKLIK